MGEMNSTTDLEILQAKVYCLEDLIVTLEETALEQSRKNEKALLELDLKARALEKSERDLRMAKSAVENELHQRKILEIAHLEMASFQSAILNSANFAIISTDDAGIIRSFNKTAERLLGYQTSELIGKVNPGLFHLPEEVVGRAEILSKELGKPIEPGFEVFVAKARLGIPDENEWTYVRKDGFRFPVLLSVTQMRDEFGKSLGFMGVAHDISDRKLSEKKVQNATKRLETILQNAVEGIVTIDGKGTVESFNKSAERLFGYPAAEVIGNNVKMLMPEPYRSNHDGYLHNYMTTGVAKIIGIGREVVGRRKDGTTFPLELSVAENHLEGIRIFTGILRDITEQKRVLKDLQEARDQAENTNRAKSEFLAKMSHELRTPLNSVIGFSNILLKNKDGRLVQKEMTFLERIRDNGMHLLGLINNILDLSKVEANKIELEIKSTSLNSLISETVDSLQGQVKEKQTVQLLADLPPDCRPISTDQTRLKQIIINLISNALKFTENGTVTVRLKVDPDSGLPQVIEVADTGIGIPRDRFEKIFEAFQQADNSTTRKYGGTGLGLTIARSFAQLLGFRIDLESEIGKGTVFRVHLGPNREALEMVPPAAESSWSRRGGSDLGPSGRGKTALVIDDEADSRTITAQQLVELGFQVIMAPTGVVGLELASVQHPDIILLDLLMPEMDGFEVIRRLRENPATASIPIVVISLVAKEKRGLILSHIDAINKPVMKDELMAVLKRNLRGSGGVETCSILIVDDDADQRELIQNLVKEHASVIETANSGRSALAILQTRAFNLIFLDLMMPEMDGFSFLDVVRKDPRFKEIPIVVFTAKDLTLDEKTRLFEQASGVIKKGGDIEAPILHALRVCERER